MNGRMVRFTRFSPIAVVLALAACGGGGTTTVTITQSTTTPTSPSTATTTTPTTATTLVSFRAYFLHEGKMQPVLRTAPKTLAVANAAVETLPAGPTVRERKELGLHSTVTGGQNDLHVMTITDGVAHVEGATGESQLALAQIVFTVSQFATVKSVEIDGTRYTRANFENDTPAILVELPLPYQVITNPLRVAGSANTFEATFNYELIGPDGKVIDKDFVTATSGSGTRGSFDFKIPFSVDRTGRGTLAVYELSAKDGSEINRVDIPVTLQQ